jgi:hypothetical protein
MRPELESELQRIRRKRAFTGFNAQSVKLLSSVSPLISTEELPEVMPRIRELFGFFGGFWECPKLVRQVVAEILQGQSATVVCDPWAGIGELLAPVSVATHAKKALAFARDEYGGLGPVLFHAAEWHFGDSLRLLASLKTDLDVVASVLPFEKSVRAIVLRGLDGHKIELRDFLGPLILVTAAMRLSTNGVGLFIVPLSFFLSGRSVLRQFAKIGLTIQGALALPSGTFTPFTNISTFLVIVKKKGTSDHMFVAQLSSDTKANDQIIANFREGKEGGTLELGRFVDAQSFRGLNAIRTTERFEAAASKFDAPSVLLGDLATAINLGRRRTDFKFAHHDNAIFVPLIGSAMSSSLLMILL